MTWRESEYTFFGLEIWYLKNTLVFLWLDGVQTIIINLYVAHFDDFFIKNHNAKKQQRFLFYICVCFFQKQR